MKFYYNNYLLSDAETSQSNLQNYDLGYPVDTLRELGNLLILSVHHMTLKMSQIMCLMVALIPWLGNHEH